MNPHKQNTGIGDYQAGKAFDAISSILKVLLDGQWHRNMELKEKTKLSSRTLAKHLNQMINLKIIERKEDVESGKYPVPVLYKAIFYLATYAQADIARERTTNSIEPALDKTKDPLLILDEIHDFSQANFVMLLQGLQDDKDITNEEINLFAECFLWAPYKQYTSKLIEASRKIINDLNITQLLINQSKRRIEDFQTLSEICRKMKLETPREFFKIYFKKK